MILQHGLDDLRHGVETLLAVPPGERATIAKMIAREIGGINATAAGDLVRAVLIFAELGRDPAPVREAFACFAVDCGPWIGASNHKSAVGVAANKRSRKAAADGGAEKIKQAAPRFTAAREKLKAQGKPAGYREIARLARQDAGLDADKTMLSDHYARKWLEST